MSDPRSTPIDPSVRAWLGFAEVLSILPVEEYLALISSYQAPPSAVTNHTRGLELKQARLEAMPPREEIEGYLSAHSIAEARQHFHVTNRRLYEWIAALGVYKRRRS